jgi:hypothetical protein
MKSRVLAVVLALASVASAQTLSGPSGSSLSWTTALAGGSYMVDDLQFLPYKGIHVNTIVSVSDGASSTDCVTGHGYTTAFCTWNGTSWVALLGVGTMVYAPAGVPNSTGLAWGSSYTVGTAARNLVQLDGSAKLPAVDGSQLTGMASGLGTVCDRLIVSPQTASPMSVFRAALVPGVQTVPACVGKSVFITVPVNTLCDDSTGQLLLAIHSGEDGRVGTGRCATQQTANANASQSALQHALITIELLQPQMFRRWLPLAADKQQAAWWGSCWPPIACSFPLPAQSSSR